MEKNLIIGTRGSQLALWQANHVSDLLQVPNEIKIIKTSGDKLLNQPLQGQLDKGFFTKEIEEKLIAKEIDLAVHSLKDLPTELPEGLTLGAVSKRASINDLILVREEMVDLKQSLPVKSGSIIGATSLRRISLLRKFDKNLKDKMLRGNVPTRIKKLQNGEYDAIIIAKAGVERLDLDTDGLVVFELNPKIWLPAPGQGVLGIEIRENDKDVEESIAVIHDEQAKQAIYIERELLSRFEGGCHAAFGAWAYHENGLTHVYVGHENSEGIWMAAYAFSADYKEAMENAYDKMKKLLDGSLKEETTDGELWWKLER